MPPPRSPSSSGTSKRALSPFRITVIGVCWPVDFRAKASISPSNPLSIASAPEPTLVPALASPPAPALPAGVPAASVFLLHAQGRRARLLMRATATVVRIAREEVDMATDGRTDRAPLKRL